VESRRQLRRVGGDPGMRLPETTWPGSIPAVRELLSSGLGLGALTVLVGNNGAGTGTNSARCDWRSFLPDPNQFLRHLDRALQR
jgi:hypothetical protein